jgi:hypothetical protein
MPFDGKGFVPESELQAAIRLLERGLARVTAGYCRLSFYRPKRWWRSAPQYCMAGSLFWSDAGGWEKGSWQYHLVAEKFLHHESGESLVIFGSRMFARRKVIKAYKRALQAAYIVAKEEVNAF